MYISMCVLIFNDTATTEIYTYCHTRSLHDALPIYPAISASDAYSASSGSAVFQALKGSAVGTGTSLQDRHCSIERRVTVLKPGADDIISRTSGGYSTIQNGSSFDFLMGSPADNSLGGGSCTLKIGRAHV